jgi:hypothetical protein
VPNILNASACPAITQQTAFVGILAAQSAANAPCSETDKSIDFATKSLWPHATRLDGIANAGGANAGAIVSGSNAGNELAISASGTPLLLSVKKGRAICGGLIELAADGTISVPDNTARVWIWILQTGVLDKTVTTTPSSPAAVLIGSCVTSGGAITSVDTSGVVYLRGSNLIRFTADPGIPTDTPPVGVLLYSVTAFGTFVWDGAAHQQVGIPEVSADPTSLANGMQWFRSDLLQPSRRTGGTTKRGVAFT